MATTKYLSLICEIPNCADAYLGKVTQCQGYGLFRFGVLCNLLIWRWKTPPPPPTINRVKDQSMGFNRSGCIAMVLHEKSSNIAWRPWRRDVSCRFSWKKKSIFFKSRCKNLLSNFESILTLKGPGFSDFGTVRGGDGTYLHL